MTVVMMQKGTVPSSSGMCSVRLFSVTMIVWRRSKSLLGNSRCGHKNGYGSIPMKIAFLVVGWTSINPSYDLGFTRYQGFDTLPNPKISGQESCPSTTTYFILFHNCVRMSEAMSSEAQRQFAWTRWLHYSRLRRQIWLRKWPKCSNHICASFVKGWIHALFGKWYG